MKKEISIFLFVLFMFSAFSGKLKAHFCGNMLSAIALSEVQVDEEACCGDDNDCCTDKEIKADIDKEFIKEAYSAKEKISKSVSLCTPKNCNYEHSPSSYLDCTIQIFSSKPPPHIVSQPFRILCCSFLI